MSSPSGTLDMGSSHEKASLGPSYEIWITAVTVPSPFWEKMMRSAAWFTGCACEQKKPPQARAGGATSPSAAAAAAATMDAETLLLVMLVLPLGTAPCGTLWHNPRAISLTLHASG